MTAPGTVAANNDFVAQWADIGTDVLTACERVGKSGWYVLGTEVRAFEQELATAWGVPHAVGTGNGMDALEIALRAAGLRPGDRVLTTPLSAFATTLAIVRAGGVPVFADVDASGLLDLSLADALCTADASLRWMLPVHLYGHCLDLRELTHLQEKHGIRVIEDCAQSVGASFHGTPCGTVGMAAATSFYPTKNLGALGDGGAILTRHGAMADACRCLRDYGQSAKYHHAEAGLNSRLDELQAAILRTALLPRLPGFTARRRAIAARYFDGIRSAHVRPVPEPAGSQGVFHLFPVLVDGDREAFMAHLRTQGVQSAVHYPVLIPAQPALAAGAFECLTPLGRASHFAAAEVSLPVHPQLSDDAVRAVVDAVNSWKPS